MIKYNLACTKGHEFESWFGSSSSFEEQLDSGLVVCPFCGSDEVNKTIMAPQVARKDRILSKDAKAMRQQLTALYRKATQNADNVGDAFPEEARKMHYGEADARPIYGKTSLVEAKELVEEGIPILPLPTLPDEQN